MNDKMTPSYCCITGGTVTVNGKRVFTAENSDTGEPLLTRIYRSASLSYPKFFKMDNLSKTGYLAAEYLLRGTPVDTPEIKPDVAVVLMNSHASLDTDTSFQETISNPLEYFPSPSIFVYTLPNIMLGEICIRFKITGEGIVFISGEIDNDLIYHYIAALFNEGKCDSCIFGWVDFYADTPEAFLAIVYKESFNAAFDNGAFSRFVNDSFKPIIS